jgi:hypothetical protein
MVVGMALKYITVFHLFIHNLTFFLQRFPLSARTFRKRNF